MEQHFLVSPEALEVLVRHAGIRPTDRVVELGAGSGTVAAALPPCALTLVELDAELAENLRRRFPEARVVQGDALEALDGLHFEVLLSNLPHALTKPLLKRLREKRFQRALVAMHEDENLEALENGLRLEPLRVLHERDFSPPQPFKSKLVRVTHKQVD